MDSIAAEGHSSQTCLLIQTSEDKEMEINQNETRLSEHTTSVADNKCPTIKISESFKPSSPQPASVVSENIPDPEATDMALSQTAKTIPSSTDKEMEIDQIQTNNTTAQTTNIPENDSANDKIPEKPNHSSSQPISVTSSHFNQISETKQTDCGLSQTCTTGQSSISKEMESNQNETDITTQTKSVPYDEGHRQPSCHSQEAQASTFDKTVQERDLSENLNKIEVSIPSTSKNYAINIMTCETSSKSEPSDQFMEIGARKEFDTLCTPKVNIYAEDMGPKFYDINDKFISKPIIPTMLSEAFSDLPVFGRPKYSSNLQQFQDDKIKEFVGCGLDDNEFQQLATYCSPENLRTGQELTMLEGPGKGLYPSEMERINKDAEHFTINHDLSIVRKLKLRVEKDTKNLYTKRFKYRGIRMMGLGNNDDDNTPVVTLGTPVMPGKDLLFIIRWYRPFPYNPQDKNQYRSRHSVFSCNIVMLGRQKLSMLRDRVVCPNDIDMRVDVSDRPDELPRSTAKEMFPSGFLFLNNVFYVDTRAGCADNSLPVRRWASARGLGDFPARDMGHVRLEELRVRLGHPEVYVHQGNCEHLFTISEIRLVNASDPLKLAAYPCHTALSQNQTIYCTTCAEFGAKWIVVGCPRVPFDPAFFCEKCFKLYLYKDGKKIGDFKAYLYRGNEINVLKPQG